jgi:SSS family solute:Na+ symporter
VYSLTPKADRTDPNESSLPWYQQAPKLAIIGVVLLVILNVIFR